jgi:5'-nucleotidase
MPFELSDKLVIGISSRALFDLERENEIFEKGGVLPYADYQLSHEDEALVPGTAFPLVEALLGLNGLIPGKQFVEVVLMSRNSPDTGLRAMNAIERAALPVTRAAFTGGEPITRYLEAFKVDLFLSKSAEDVEAALDAGFAAAQLYAPPDHEPDHPDGRIRIAFDGDAVLFSPESEQIYQTQGLEAFVAHERAKRHVAMGEGPFAKLLLMLSELQKQFPARDCPVRIAIVTARSSPTHARVIHTLRAWNVAVDEAFFLGGVSKDEVLASFGAHIFFDDQDTHVARAARRVPSAKVPNRAALTA